MESYESVANVIETLNQVKVKIDDYNMKWFKEAENMAKQIGVTPSMPRIVTTMQHRWNAPAKNEEEYFRRNVVIPTLNQVQLEKMLIYKI